MFSSLPVQRKLSVVSACLGLSAVILLSACGTPAGKDETINWSPNKIYSEAKDEMNAGSYAKAIPLLEKLEGRAAGTVLAQQAQLDKAYAQYKNDEKAQALVTLDRFIRLNPASPVLDYAYFLKGIVNFNDNLGPFSFITRQDMSERDQKASKEAYLAFQDVVTRFPQSRYAMDARQRATYIVNSLAQYEVHVARYYYTRGAYLAAINRAQQAIVDYRDVPALEEALFVIVQSYDALGMTTLRNDTMRVMQNSFPKSQYVSNGFKGRSIWRLW